MILMSDDLSDRIILEHDEETVTDASVASVTFLVGSDVLGASAVKKMSFTTDAITFTFTCVPALAFTLATTPSVRCILEVGHHLVDYDLQDVEVTWDNGEGKQACTIITKIDKTRSKQ